VIAIQPSSRPRFELPTLESCAFPGEVSAAALQEVTPLKPLDPPDVALDGSLHFGGLAFRDHVVEAFQYRSGTAA
jgi:hypothetical protein